MKRIMVLALLLCLALSCLLGMTLEQDSEKAWYPERLGLFFSLSETEKEQVSYLMVYLNGQEVDLIDIYSPTFEIGGSGQELWPETVYEARIIGFSKQDEEVCSASCSARTGSWSGLYRWVNPTDNDNKGRCKEIVVRVVLSSDKSQGGNYYDLFNPYDDGDRKFFPIEPILGDDKKYKSHDWDEDSECAETYRRGASQFNTTSLTPSKWKVSHLEVSPTRYNARVKSSAFLFTVNTVTDYLFRVNQANGEKELLFIMDGDGLCKMGLFFNPAPPEEGKTVFVLKKIGD